MKIINYSFTLLIILIISCGQADRKANTKDEIKYDEKPLTAPTEILTAAENYNNGYMAFQSNNYNKAIEFYRKAILLDPNFIDAYDNCGLSYRRLGNLDSAAYFYKASIKIDPTAVIAHGNLAIVYSEKGDLENAIKEYEEISKYHPNDPEASYGIAGIYLHSKQYDKALISAKKSAELFEKYAPEYVGDAYYYVGLSYFKLNDKKNAIKFMQKAIQKGTQVPKDILSELGLK